MTPLLMCFDTVYIFRVEIGGDRSAFSHTRFGREMVPNYGSNLDRMTRHLKKWSDRLALDVLANHGRHGVLTLSSFDFPFRHLRHITMHHAAARRITPNPRNLIDPVI